MEPVVYNSFLLGYKSFLLGGDNTVEGDSRIAARLAQTTLLFPKRDVSSIAAGARLFSLHSSLGDSSLCKLAPGCFPAQRHHGGNGSLQSSFRYLIKAVVTRIHFSIALMASLRSILRTPCRFSKEIAAPSAGRINLHLEHTLPAASRSPIATQN